VKPVEAPKAAEPVVQAPAPAHATQGDVTIAFDKTSSELTPAAENDLANLAAQMKTKPNQRLQIRAYATDAASNESNARRMSLSRALMVRAYLVEKGVKPVNLDVRALGSENGATPSDAVILGFVK
jgi:outer membrane protein OmpA-like peptidoglycan-associated protein